MFSELHINTKYAQLTSTTWAFYHRLSQNSSFQYGWGLCSKLIRIKFYDIIPHPALQVYYNGISNEEGGLQPLLLLITINSFCHTYFYLQTSELLSGKAFNSMSNILHFDVRNVSIMILA